MIAEMPLVTVKCSVPKAARGTACPEEDQLVESSRPPRFAEEDHREADGKNRSTDNEGPNHGAGNCAKNLGQ